MWRDAIRSARILIVDSDANAVLELESILQGGGYTHIIGTTNARQALPLYRAARPDMVLLDMAGTGDFDGFAVLRQLGMVLPGGTHLPIIAMAVAPSAALKCNALECGADDFLHKPLDAVEVLLRMRNLLRMHHVYRQLERQKQLLEERVQARTQELERTECEMLEHLALAAEYRDDDTGQHTKRVAHTAMLLAQGIKMPAAEVELLRQAAPLHDIGKIGIADGILLKTGTLTAEEIETMRTHTTIGAQILSGSRSAMLQVAEKIAVSHHEYWNGKGYPRGLAGEEIPLAGRIVAIADVFDALTNSRPYKEAWPLPRAIAEIERQAGKQFDPRLVQAFLAIPRHQLLLDAAHSSPS